MAALTFGIDRLCGTCLGTGAMRWKSGNGGPVLRRVHRETALDWQAGRKVEGVNVCGSCNGTGLVRPAPTGTP